MVYKVKTTFDGVADGFHALDWYTAQLHNQVINPFVDDMRVSATPVIADDASTTSQYVVVREAASEADAIAYAAALAEFFASRANISTYAGSEVISE